MDVCDVLIKFAIVKGRSDSLMQLKWRFINNTYTN